MKRIRIHLGARSHDVVIGRRVLSQLPAELERLGLEGKMMIVSQRRIIGLHADRLATLKRKFSAKVHAVPGGEVAKSERELFRLYGALLGAGLGRQSLLVAFGGGVVGDLTGFAASTYFRGIPFINIPTTLLAQVDSSIGGKTGINLREGKNLIGSFYQPRLVLSDVALLGTLPGRELTHSLAEIIKYAVIADPGLFNLLEQSVDGVFKKDLRLLEEVVVRCAEIKKGVVEKDEFEQRGRRWILNYGHTFGHAFEAAGDYHRISHGEAVACGMIAAGNLSARLGDFPVDQNAAQRNLIRRARLPCRLSRFSLSRARIWEALHHDKKKGSGGLRLILPVAIGKVKVAQGIREDWIREAIEELL